MPIRVRYHWVRQILETYQQFYDVIFHVVCIYLQHRYDTVFDVINNPIFAFAFNFDEGLEKICTKEALEVAKKTMFELALKTNAQMLIFWLKPLHYKTPTFYKYRLCILISN